MKLTKCVVRRGGATATSWTREPGSSARVLPFSSGGLEYETGIVTATSIPSKGGGITEIEIIVSSENFHILMEAMLRAEKNTATQAFAKAILATAKG